MPLPLLEKLLLPLLLGKQLIKLLLLMKLLFGLFFDLRKGVGLEDETAETFVFGTKVVGRTDGADGDRFWTLS